MPVQSSVKTAKKPPGKPFPKGRSGNPGGRPKKDPEVTEILKAAVPEAAKRLVELTHSDNERIALSACEALLDRVLGKAETAGRMELSGPGLMPPPTILVNFTDSRPVEEL